MKKTLIASVACLSFFCFSEKSEAASLAEILGIIGNEIVVDGTSIDIGDISLFSNNNSGNGGSAPAPQQPTTTNNYNAPVVTNNYFGPVVNNFFSGPTFNFTPNTGSGGSVLPPIFGGGGGLPIFNPIIIIGPVNINITINITIFNGPVSIARSGGF